MDIPDYADLVYLVLNHREVVQNYVSLNQDNKLHIQLPNYHSIFHASKEWDKLTLESINRRYSPNKSHYISRQLIAEIRPTLAPDNELSFSEFLLSDRSLETSQELSSLEKSQDSDESDHPSVGDGR